MQNSKAEFVGIDVGGRRKGFHACALQENRLVAGPVQLPDARATLNWVKERKPAVIAIDSPRSCARKGERSRDGERALAREVCGIRWTPDRPSLDASSYYEWIVCGLELYSLLTNGTSQGTTVVEVFPTASWTVWAGERKRSRATWTRTALLDLGIEKLPERRLNQDDRDAIAAAATAYQYALNETHCFGEIVVPMKRAPWMGAEPTDASTQPSKGSVRMPGGVSYAKLEPGEQQFQLLRRELEVSSFGLNLITLRPRQRGGIHRHERQEEVYLVLEGQLTLAFEEEERTLGQGELARVGPEVRRQLVNRSEAPTVLLAIGGSGEHQGRDGRAWGIWEEGGEGRPPQEVPQPEDLPAP